MVVVFLLHLGWVLGRYSIYLFPLYAYVWFVVSYPEPVAVVPEPLTLQMLFNKHFGYLFGVSPAVWDMLQLVGLFVTMLLAMLLHGLFVHVLCNAVARRYAAGVGLVNAILDVSFTTIYVGIVYLGYTTIHTYLWRPTYQLDYDIDMLELSACKSIFDNGVCLWGVGRRTGVGKTWWHQVIVAWSGIPIVDITFQYFIRLSVTSWVLVMVQFMVQNRVLIRIVQSPAVSNFLASIDAFHQIEEVWGSLATTMRWTLSQPRSVHPILSVQPSVEASTPQSSSAVVIPTTSAGVVPSGAPLNTHFSSSNRSTTGQGSEEPPDIPRSHRNDQSPSDTSNDPYFNHCSGNTIYCCGVAYQSREPKSLEETKRATAAGLDGDAESYPTIYYNRKVYTPITSSYFPAAQAAIVGKVNSTTEGAAIARILRERVQLRHAIQASSSDRSGPASPDVGVAPSAPVHPTSTTGDLRTGRMFDTPSSNLQLHAGVRSPELRSTGESHSSPGNTTELVGVPASSNDDGGAQGVVATAAPALFTSTGTTAAQLLSSREKRPPNTDFATATKAYRLLCSNGFRVDKTRADAHGWYDTVDPVTHIRYWVNVNTNVALTTSQMRDRAINVWLDNYAEARTRSVGGGGSDKLAQFSAYLQLFQKLLADKRFILIPICMFYSDVRNMASSLVREGLEDNAMYYLQHPNDLVPLSVDQAHLKAAWTRWRSTQ